MPALLIEYPGYTDISEHQPGYAFICRSSRYSYIPARPDFGQPTQSQSYSLYISSLLTLPGVIPPTLVPEAVKVPQS
jgi:hypothetical protein